MTDTDTDAQREQTDTGSARSCDELAERLDAITGEEALDALAVRFDAIMNAEALDAIPGLLDGGSF